MRKKIRVGIFFGGVSPEHEVSIASAKGVISNIDRRKFHVDEIFIDKKGKLWRGVNVLKKVQSGKHKLLRSLDINGVAGKIDVAFPVLHGKGGEDGSIQGFFEILNIPYVGAGIMSSSVGLDKEIFKKVMDASGIAQAKYGIIDWKYQDKGEIKKTISKLKKELRFPLFVKPARTGSSIGINKARTEKDLEIFLSRSRKFDSKVIVEESVEKPGEIEVSVLGNGHSDIKASLPGKVIPGAEFYDYNDKYKNNKTVFEIPVNLPRRKIEEIRKLAIKAYKAVGCEGLARVDFLLDEKSKVYINEINTLPGFTPISMYPKMWEASGLKYKNLITKLLHLAMRNKNM